MEDIVPWILSAFSSNFQASFKVSIWANCKAGVWLAGSALSQREKTKFLWPRKQRVYPPLRQVISGCFNFIHLATSETPSPVPLCKLNSRPNWDIYLLPPTSGSVLTNVTTKDNQRSNLAPVTAPLVLHGRQECSEARSNSSGVRGTCSWLLTWSCSSCVTSGKLCYLAEAHILHL